MFQFERESEQESQPLDNQIRASETASAVGANDPTGEVCLLSHRLPQPPQLASFLPIASPQNPRSLFSPAPNIPTPLRSTSDKAAPSFSKAISHRPGNHSS
jgi:hypothetical protein